ncbi:MAG: transcription termination factor Rho [Traorella sp.]
MEIKEKYEENEDMVDAIEKGETITGILEVLEDGYGFIRSDNYLSGNEDVYVSASQIRRFNLKTGDFVSGIIRQPKNNEKFKSLMYTTAINNCQADVVKNRIAFEDLTPIYPASKFVLGFNKLSLRLIDLLSPIGKGQRGIIVSPPKAGKTTLLKDIALSMKNYNQNVHLIILLIDERPEEVTDIKEAVTGEHVEVIYSTFDEKPEKHKKVAEMVIERAKRLCECGQDVVILLDSITRLARAYNLICTPSGRTLSGGLDPASLYMPKRFFGAARNTRESGSLTILATALVETGSKMDDVIFEEFKGTGNMEIVLSRQLQEKRIFPAIDLAKSGTRRDDLLLSQTQLEAVNRIRKSLNGLKSDQALESLLTLFRNTKTNEEVIDLILNK